MGLLLFVFVVASQVRVVGVGMAALVKLKYGEKERSTRLINNQLHIPTIKDMFGLSSVDVEGVAEPADDKGFTFQTYWQAAPYRYLEIVLQVCSTPLTCYVAM